jgi:hypothetical protein
VQVQIQQFARAQGGEQFGGVNLRGEARQPPGEGQQQAQSGQRQAQSAHGGQIQQRRAQFLRQTAALEMFEPPGERAAAARADVQARLILRVKPNADAFGTEALERSCSLQMQASAWSKSDSGLRSLRCRPNGVPGRRSAR